MPRRSPSQPEPAWPEPWPFLHALHARYHRPEFIAPDPIEIPHSYPERTDREVSAWLAAAFSYGRVAQILLSTRRVLDRLGEHPAEAVQRLDFAALRLAMRGLGHRLSTGDDIALFLAATGESLRRHGTLEDHFAQAIRPTDRADDLTDSLARWMDELRGFAAEIGGARRAERLSFGHLLPDPARGSACKRLHMFMRWVGRPADGVDLGLWPSVDPARLLMPVDTHILRLARHLSLTERRDASLRTSREITAALRQAAPGDPTRFDFALCRLGIQNHCPARERLDLCATCTLSPVCRRRLALTEGRPWIDLPGTVAA